MQFSQAQRCAVEHGEGPCLALAGPGSGKTTVLTHRILHLIEERQIKPQHILVITFTKMAALEMKERFCRLSDNKYPDVTFGTFHSIFFTILKHAYHYTASSIIRPEEQSRFLYGILHNYSLEITDTTEFANQMLSFIGQAKACERNSEVFTQLCKHAPCPENVAKDIYQKYQIFLQNNKKIDFEDMMVYCYELFLQRKDILDMWQEKYMYLLIDEFQDINQMQYDIVQLLAKKYQNLFIVGDDDQSIYGFRGAKPDFMKDFMQTYKTAKIVRLSVNYRCAPAIVAAAKRVIDHNKNRFEKNIMAADGKQRNFADVQFCSFETEMEEYVFLAEEIQRKRVLAGGYEHMAVLVRTNAGAGLLTQELVRKGIPFTTKEHLTDVFSHWMARDIFAYLRIAAGSRERKYFLQIANKPLRYISREALIQEPVSFVALRQFYADKMYMIKRVDALQSDVAFLSRMQPFAAINYIRKAVGYDDFIVSYAKEQQMDVEKLLQILDEIQASSRMCQNLTEWMAYIADYQEQLKKQEQMQEKQTGVCICTMHASKGLEYHTVFLPDACEGITPFHRAKTAAEIEEERRMFYVAMTRAKEKLYICVPKTIAGKKKEPSRFVEEIGEVLEIPN